MNVTKTKLDKKLSEHSAHNGRKQDDRDKAAAARLSGFGARSGASLLALPVVKAEIERRQSEKTPEAQSQDALQALIREADAAIALAKESSNAAGVVAAIQLKARLLGVLQGNELVQEETPPVQTATRCPG